MTQQDEDRLPQALDALDRLLEHRARLAIAVLLTRFDQLSFIRLRELTGETDGNLGAHMRRLGDAGYVATDKRFEEGKPVTRYTITDGGRHALRRHLQALETLISAADAGNPPES